MRRYYVLYPDPNVREIIARLKRVVIDEVPEHEAVSIAEFDDRTAAHDFAEGREGANLYERYGLTRLSNPDGPGEAWGYTPVLLRDRPTD